MSPDLDIYYLEASVEVLGRVSFLCSFKAVKIFDPPYFNFFMLKKSVEFRSTYDFETRLNIISANFCSRYLSSFYSSWAVSFSVLRSLL